MKRLLQAGRSCWEEMGALEISLLKCCLCAFGALLGLRVSEKKRQKARHVARFLFWVTYLPLLGKLLRQLKKGSEEEMIELHFVAKEKDLKEHEA